MRPVVNGADLQAQKWFKNPVVFNMIKRFFIVFNFTQSSFKALESISQFLF